MYTPPAFREILLLLAPEEGTYGTLYGRVARANARAACNGTPSPAISLSPPTHL